MKFKAMYKAQGDRAEGAAGRGTWKHESCQALVGALHLDFCLSPLPQIPHFMGEGSKIQTGEASLSRPPEGRRKGFGPQSGSQSQRKPRNDDDVTYLPGLQHPREKRAHQVAPCPSLGLSGNAVRGCRWGLQVTLGSAGDLGSTGALFPERVSACLSLARLACCKLGVREGEERRRKGSSSKRILPF